LSKLHRINKNTSRR